MIPARALNPSTCWRVAIAPDAVTWYMTRERALRAWADALETGLACWLIDPVNTVIAAEPICDRCTHLGYPASECHVRR